MVLGSFQDVLDAAPGLHGEGPDLHVELPGCGIQVRHVLTQGIVLRQVNKKKGRHQYQIIYKRQNLRQIK